jgi:phosphonopyruvate decarboxylase
VIDPAAFFAALSAEGIEFVAGVPDSLLKDVCLFIDEALPRERHVIAAHEGGALALAAGHHLATGEVGLVYLQNSGLGNLVNPLLSLMDAEVYALPVVLLIGWRGEPGVADEPQHRKQGRVTPALLEAMEIPYRVLDGNAEAGLAAARWAVAAARAASAPVALLVRKGAFAPYRGSGGSVRGGDLPTREAAIAAVVEALPADAVVVASTGMIGRELYELRRRRGANGALDFLTVGAMGHASQIALGIARAQPARPVVCLDGDGALLMHLGGLGIIGQSGASNLLHVVLNNGAHDSVGGQPTVAWALSLPALAQGCGYLIAERAEGPLDALGSRLGERWWLAGPRFLEVRVAVGSRADLGRPQTSPVENKRGLMEGLRARAQPGAGLE